MIGITLAYKAGGPLKSVFHLVSQLNERYDFMIVSSNKDIDGKELDVNPNEIIEEDGIKKNIFVGISSK